jgi:cell division protein DivIC
MLRQFFRWFFSLSFYKATLFAFVVWMVLFDSNDVFTLYKLRGRLYKLEEEKIFYEQAIKEVEMERQEVMGTIKLVEKYAREKYFMKRQNEDVFILVNDEDELWEE